MTEMDKGVATRLIDFINRSSDKGIRYLQHRSEFVDMEFPVSLYLRYGWYMTTAGRHMTLVIASVELSPSDQGKGHFRTLLDTSIRLCEISGLCLAVESVNNERLAAYLERRGFMLIDGTINSYSLDCRQKGHLNVEPD